MKPLILFLTILNPLRLSPVTSLPQDRDPGVVTISSFIARQAGRELGEEYEDARKIVVGDLNGDRIPETVVLYTIESQGGSNNYIQYLAVFSRRAGHLVAVTHTPVGGKFRRSVELESVNNQRVNLQTLSYASRDPSCCPTIKSTTSYVLVGHVLRERKPPRKRAIHR